MAGRRVGVAVFERLLPEGTVVVEGPVEEEPAFEALFPEERSLLVGAVVARRREFAAGRRYARRALVALGLPPVAIPAGPGREPRWPPGVTGSITHCQGYCAVGVGWQHAVGSLGIDLEVAEPLTSDVERLVCNPAERRRAAALRPHGPWSTVVFSAKESLYKAWFPLTRRWLDFHQVEVEIDPVRGDLVARLERSAQAVLGAADGHVHGRFRVEGGYVATAVAILGATPEGRGSVRRQSSIRPPYR